MRHTSVHRFVFVMMDGFATREALAAVTLLAATGFAGAGIYAQFGIDPAREHRTWHLLSVPGNGFALAALTIAILTAWPNPAARGVALCALLAFATVNAIAVYFLSTRFPRADGDHMPIAIGVNAAMATAVYFILSR